MCAKPIILQHKINNKIKRVKSYICGHHEVYDWLIVLTTQNKFKTINAKIKCDQRIKKQSPVGAYRENTKSLKCNPVLLEIKLKSDNKDCFVILDEQLQRTNTSIVITGSNGSFINCTHKFLSFSINFKISTSFL